MPKKCLVTPAAKKTKKNSKPWLNGYADFGGDIGKIFDKDVADYTRKHLRIVDRFSIRKIVAAAMVSFDILNGSIEEPKIKNGKWKFYKNY